MSPIHLPDRLFFVARIAIVDRRWSFVNDGLLRHRVLMLLLQWEKREWREKKRSLEAAAAAAAVFSQGPDK